MSEVARLYRYKSLLVNRQTVSAADLTAALEISPATVKRDLTKLRDQLHVPIGFDRDLGGYMLEIPYSDERELLGDILRFGAAVEVLQPADLRKRIKQTLHEAAGRYV